MRTILDAHVVRQTIAIAGEANEIRHARIRDLLDALLVGGHEFVVMLHAVPCALDAAEFVDDGIAHHRARQPVLLQRGEIVAGIEQFNRGQAEVLARHAKVVERNVRVTPFANGMMHAALHRGRGGVRSEEALRKGSRGDRHGTGAGDAGDGGTAGELSFHGIGDLHE